MNISILVIFTSVFFIFFLLFALFKPKNKLWSWVDVFYYPLGAIGVVLLFFSNNEIRSIFNLNEELSVFKNQLEVIDTTKPQINNNGFITDNLINIHYKYLKMISDYHKGVCDSSLSSECKTIGNVVEITRKYEHHFLTKYSEDSIASLCEATSTMIDELVENSAFSSFVSSDLKIYYLNGVNSHNYFMTSDMTTKFVVNFIKSKRVLYQKSIKSGSFSKKNKQILTSLYESELTALHNVLYASSICLSSPKNISNGEYRNWANSKQVIKSDLISKEDLLSKLKESDKRVSPLNKFIFFSWPYFLVFALSLKFGKAISTVSDSILGPINFLINFLYKKISKN